MKKYINHMWEKGIYILQCQLTFIEIADSQCMLQRMNPFVALITEPYMTLSVYPRRIKFVSKIHMIKGVAPIEDWLSS